jgi:hypothetical protein
LFGKLAFCRWQRWPREEQEGLLDYFQEYWTSAVRSYSHLEATELALCCLAQAVDDITPYLRLWLYYGDAPEERGFLEASLQQMRGFIAQNRDALLSWGGLRNPFWQDRALVQNQAVEWVLSPLTLRALESRWEDRQHAVAMGADVDWLQDTMTALAGLHNARTQ